ncbi:MAG: FecCD family ABC transporter permease [Bacillota bacterium]
MKATKGFLKGNIYKTIFITLLLAIIVFFISLSLGSTYISIPDIFKIIFNLDISNLETERVIIKNIRLPRIVMSFVVGSGLAIAGVIFQGIIRNPMADPYIVGISAGAGTGVSAAIVLGISFSVFGIDSLPIMAFIGASITVYVVYNLAKVDNKVPVMSFLLAGVAVGYVLNAFTSFLMVIGSEDLNKIVYWLMGSLANSSWSELKMILPYYFIGLIPISLFLNDLNIILLGEENAQYLGVNVERVKMILIVAATLITASVVSVSGSIGFVGLVIPHITRMLIGPDHRKLLPFAAIFGGIFMMISDDLARFLLAPLEIPVGIITSLAGGPYFIYLLRKKKNSSW